jgi:glycosyltransferase involved in cell wall biosynthesis
MITSSSTLHQNVASHQAEQTLPSLIPDSIQKTSRQLEPVTLNVLSESPLVSVLIANYNYAEYVGEAIESVLKQTYANFEVIVCDDGSSDKSCEVIERYVQRDSRVQLIRQQNKGQASAWNAAYSMHKGQIICTLDADDMFTPEKLNILVNYLKHQPDIGFVVHPLLIIDQVGNYIQQIPFLTRFEEGWIAMQVVDRGGRWRFMPASALCFRSALGEHIFPIPEELFRRTADGFVFTLAPLLTQIGYIEQGLSCYRVHGSNGLGSMYVNQTTVQKGINSVERVVQGVNLRLRDLGLHENKLDIQRNLTFREQTFFFSLLTRKPRSYLLKEYRFLIPLLFRDDLYRRSQKLLGVFVYGIAILLPTQLRSWWLTNTLGFSRRKYHIQRIIDRLKPKGLKR